MVFIIKAYILDRKGKYMLSYLQKNYNDHASQMDDHNTWKLKHYLCWHRCTPLFVCFLPFCVTRLNHSMQAPDWKQWPNMVIKIWSFFFITNIFSFQPTVFIEHSVITNEIICNPKRTIASWAIPSKNYLVLFVRK